MRGVAKLARGDGHVGLLDIPEPQPGPGQVVLEVTAAGICGTDLHIYHDEYPTNPPVILGHEVAGVVAETGPDVTTCRTGDRVTSETYFYVCGECGYCRDGQVNLCLQRKSIGSGVHGAFTRYVLVPEQNIHRLPDSVETRAGALTEPLACCVHALEMTQVEPSDVAVVSGPGTIGLLMAQVVKAAGATVVVLGTAADAPRLDKARSLGMDLALDVESPESRETILALTDGRGADMVFECAGAGASARNCLDLVRRRGRYAQVGLFGKPITWDLEQVCFKEVRVSGSFATVPSAWRKALQLMETGKVDNGALISETFSITAWEEAFRRFEERSAFKILLTPDGA